MMRAPGDMDLPGGWEAGAAEYALGLMPREEIDGFEARLASDADLQQDVAAWTEYFATFTDPIPETAPPPQVLRRIEAHVFGPSANMPSLWKQVMPYLVGAVCGAALAWIVFASGLLEPARPGLTADLRGDAGLVLSARFEPSTGVLTVDREAGAAGEGRVLELWLMPRDGGAPVSLVLLRRAQTLVALPPALTDDLDGAQLMVSVEPAGGAPGGMPTGAERAVGRLAAE